MKREEADDVMLSQEQYTRKEMLLCEMNRQEGEELYKKQKYSKAIASFSQVFI